MKFTMTEQLKYVPRVWKIQSSKPSPAKFYSALQTIRHHFNTCDEVAVLPWRYVAEMRTASSKHA